MISAIKDLVLASPVLVVFDHFGGAQARLGTDQPGFGDLLDVVRSGKAYVKISGAYRASTQAPDYASGTVGQGTACSERGSYLWGTDWPHPNSATPPDSKVTDVGVRCSTAQADPGR
jgi:predicted TIM-barrel fold metal-dependent hydrolase